jgi:hypothetical protein
MWGNGVYALCSDMCALDFVTEPSFDCGEDDAGDVAFVSATRSIGGWDIVEEYMAYGLFPLSASFGSGEIEDRETSVSKITFSLTEFPIPRLPKEINDHFWVRVELAAENVVGSYARGEHDVCVAVVPNEGRLNQVFEQASVPYGSILDPGSEANKEATKNKKNDVGAGLTGKRAEVSG